MLQRMSPERFAVTAQVSEDPWIPIEREPTNGIHHCLVALGAIVSAAYLSSLQTAYWRDHLVLSAYNGGPGNLNRWLRLVGTADPILFVDLIPNSENEQFVKKALKYAAVYRLVLQSK